MQVVRQSWASALSYVFVAFCKERSHRAIKATAQPVALHWRRSTEVLGRMVEPQIRLRMTMASFPFRFRQNRAETSRMRVHARSLAIKLILDNILGVWRNPYGTQPIMSTLPPQMGEDYPTKGGAKRYTFPTNGGIIPTKGGAKTSLPHKRGKAARIPTNGGLSKHPVKP